MKKRIAICILVMLGFLAHALWLSVFGPPARWGTDIRLADLIAPSGAIPPWMPDQLQSQAVTSPITPLLGVAVPASILVGALIHHDVSPSGHCELAQSVDRHQTNVNGLPRRYLYVRCGTAPWRTVSTSQYMAFDHAYFVKGANREYILAARLHVWCRDTRALYRRLLLSVLDPPLQSEWGVYQLDSSSDSATFLFPGRDLRVSPDRDYVGYRSTENCSGPFHVFGVFDTVTQRRELLVGMREMDPGSGPSFTHWWSDRPQVLHVVGVAGNIVHGTGRCLASNIHIAYVPQIAKLYCDGCCDSKPLPLPTDDGAYVTSTPARRARK